MVGRSGCPCQGPANSRCYPHCLSVLSCATSHCGLGRGCRAPGGWCGARLWRPPEEAAARCWSARAPRHSPPCTAQTRPRLGACRTAQNCSHHCCPHCHCGTFCQGAVSWDLCHVCRLGRPHDYLDSVGKGRAACSRCYTCPCSPSRSCRGSTGRCPLPGRTMWAGGVGGRNCWSPSGSHCCFPGPGMTSRSHLCCRGCCCCHHCACPLTCRRVASCSASCDHRQHAS